MYRNGLTAAYRSGYSLLKPRVSTMDVKNGQDQKPFVCLLSFISRSILYGVAFHENIEGHFEFRKSRLFLKPCCFALSMQINVLRIILYLIFISSVSIGKAI